MTKEKDVADELLFDPNEPGYQKPKKKVNIIYDESASMSDKQVKQSLKLIKKSQKNKRFNPFTAYFNYWVEVITA